jgi:hypothetical protein
MGDLLAGLPIGQISAGALVFIVVLLILSGRLVPRQQLIDARQQVLDARADRDQWRKSAEDWQRGTLTLGMSMEKVVVLAEATNHALVEIQELASRTQEPL